MKRISETLLGVVVLYECGILCFLAIEYLKSLLPPLPTPWLLDEIHKLVSLSLFGLGLVLICLIAYLWAMKRDKKKS
jgi:hypothetical protein